MNQQQYVCPKCGNESFTQDQFQATGGGLSKLMDVQNKRFITISCTRCGFTELYKGETDTGMNVLDFLLGS
jgi:predicted nucleic-acid-binding Zn-ribbon protein